MSMLIPGSLSLSEEVSLEEFSLEAPDSLFSLELESTRVGGLLLG